MRILIINCVFLVIVTTGHAQDSIRAVNIFRYRISDGKRSNERSVIEQKTYDKNGKLVLQIFYNDSVPAIDRFTRYYYDREKLISEESFDASGEITHIRRSAYSEKGFPCEEKYYVPLKGMMELSRTSELTWQDTSMTTRIVYNMEHKKIIRERYRYYPGRIVKEERFRKGIDPGNLKIRITTSTYSQDTLTKKEISELTYSGEKNTTLISYTYCNGRTSTEEWTGQEGRAVKRIEYTWFVNGRLNTQSSYNGSGELEEFLRYEYHHYVTRLSPEPMFDLSRPVPADH
jgi:hypothetical protein